MMRLLLTAALGPACLAAAADEDASKTSSGLHPRVKLETTMGDIVLELNAEKAPISTLNFVQYVEDGYYNGTVFHRVISNFMVQGGGMGENLEPKPGLRDPIKNEWGNGLTNALGTIAMARTNNPDSATSQFFINVQENERLDQPISGGSGYAVFGKVVEGMDTVDKIKGTPVETKGRHSNVPVETVTIKTATMITEFSKDAATKAIDSASEAAEVADAAAATERTKAMQDAIEKIQTETGKTFAKTDSGLQYLSVVDGEGASPAPTDRVKVHYTGWFLDGKKFDSSHDKGTPAEFPLNRVIAGWTEGVGMMKVGGKARLVIPYDLAYGERGRPGIPPKSILHFEVELIEIISQ